MVTMRSGLYFFVFVAIYSNAVALRAPAHYEHNILSTMTESRDSEDPESPAARFKEVQYSAPVEYAPYCTWITRSSNPRDRTSTSSTLASAYTNKCKEECRSVHPSAKHKKVSPKAEALHHRVDGSVVPVSGPQGSVENLDLIQYTSGELDRACSCINKGKEASVAFCSQNCKPAALEDVGKDEYAGSPGEEASAEPESPDLDCVQYSSKDCGACQNSPTCLANNLKKAAAKTKCNFVDGCKWITSTKACGPRSALHV